MVLIDTNIAVSLWIDNDWTDAARRLLAQDSEWRTEPYALVEFSNVMATYVRSRLTTVAQAQLRLSEAEALLTPGLYTASHRQALTTAVKFKVSAYDARFLVVAQTLDARLVTEDAKLRAAAPTLTISLAEALSRS